MSLSKDRKLEIIEQLENRSTREAQKIVASISSEPENLRPDRVRALSEDVSEIRFSAPNSLFEKMIRIKGLLAHQCPHMTDAELFDRLCDLGLMAWDPAQRRKKARLGMHLKAEQVENLAVSEHRPAAPRVNVRSRRAISAAIRREVWRRAGSRCENCGSSHALEVDHIRPIALGGGSEEENLRLLCRSCNQRAAIQKVGFSQMERFLERH
ncbi:MAG: HNH endonuclease [Bdellovibrionaceae bacterium]|nr:HNH endonuclease [Pseudobdellovibrionaceae bacterium]